MVSPELTPARPCFPFSLLACIMRNGREGESGRSLSRYGRGILRAVVTSWRPLACGAVPGGQIVRGYTGSKSPKILKVSPPKTLRDKCLASWMGDDTKTGWLEYRPGRVLEPVALPPRVGGAAPLS